MTGTILPSLPPLADDHMVTVCAACLCRCCIVASQFRCADRKRSEDTGTTERSVAHLRELKAEHHSYWRHLPGEDLDMPKCIEDIKDLAENQRAKAPNEPELFASYLTEELGLDQAMCRDALAGVWPQASAAIAKWMEL